MAMEGDLVKAVRCHYQIASEKAVFDKAHHSMPTKNAKDWDIIKTRADTMLMDAKNQLKLVFNARKQQRLEEPIAALPSLMQIKVNRAADPGTPTFVAGNPSQSASDEIMTKRHIAVSPRPVQIALNECINKAADPIIPSPIIANPSRPVSDKMIIGKPTAVQIEAKETIEKPMTVPVLLVQAKTKDIVARPVTTLPPPVQMGSKDRFEKAVDPVVRTPVIGTLSHSVFDEITSHVRESTAAIHHSFSLRFHQLSPITLKDFVKIVNQRPILHDLQMPLKQLSFSLQAYLSSLKTVLPESGSQVSLGKSFREWLCNVCSYRRSL